ncbi:MAG: EAL domain-containing protein [Sphingopyxis sp.]|nr:EAL domain-containing protein [Sphingopyxis sp.]
MDEADAVKLYLAVAQRLEIASGNGRLFRIGREHFCWTMDDQARQDIEMQLGSAAQLFNAPLLVNGRSIRATLCFGVAAGDMSDPVDTANKATLAAKRANETGPRLAWHDDRLARDADQSVMILSEFEAALASGHISVVYQPKYSLAAERIAGAEALIRWDHPERGAISPAIFVPIIERENLMQSLTLFVLDRALTDLADWNGGGGKFGCAVNISASLLSDAGFADQAAALVRRSGIDPALLTFELTETAVLSSLETAASTLDRFKQLGVKLSIDDYGTGQSTLSYLKSFAADEIKIDQSFVRLVASDNANRIMVRSTIEMAHALGISVVAEGVEDADAMKVLRDLGCDTVQGWHIGKAMVADAFSRLVGPEVGKAARAA